MAKTHFKQLVDPRYLGAYSLPQGQDIILTIREIRRETVTMMGGQKEECTIAYWMESEKPAILNVTNMKMIAKIYKTPYIEDWVGKKVQFYATTTRFGGETVECLRIRQFIPKQETALCAACGAEITAANGLSAAQVASATERRYGRKLCAKCAAQIKTQMEKTAEKTETEGTHDA